MKKKYIKLLLFTLCVFWSALAKAQFHPQPPNLITMCGQSGTPEQAYVYYDDVCGVGVKAISTSALYTWTLAALNFNVTSGPSNSECFPLPFQGQYRLFFTTPSGKKHDCTLLLTPNTNILYSTMPTTLRSDPDQAKEVGSIQGSASVSLTGGANYSIPIAIPSGTNGMEPNLSIAYNSQAKSGILGQGWALTGLSEITRVGTSYNDVKHDPVAASLNYNYFSLDGNRLVNIGGTSPKTEYATKTETFSRIYGYSNSSTVDYFTVETKNGQTIEYGNSTASKLSNVAWKISKSTDPSGNYIQYKYLNYGNEILLDEISYTGNGSVAPYNKIKFNYALKEDKNLIYFANTPVANSFVLKQIVVTSEGVTHSIYNFKYATNNIGTYLTEVELEGFEGSASKKINSTLFKYGDALSPQNALKTENGTRTTNLAHDIVVGDFDGNGLSDYIRAKYSGYQTSKKHYEFEVMTRNNTGDGFNSTQTITIPTASQSVISVLENSNVNFFNSDYNGDGMDDLFFVEKEELTKKGPSFNPVTPSWGTWTYTELKSIDIYEAIGGGTLNTTPKSLNIPSTHNIAYGDWFVKFHNKTVRDSINPMKRFLINGDFNGDSKADYLTILSDFNTYKVFLNFPDTDDEINLEVKSRNPNFATELVKAEAVLPLDFNGDGETDLMVLNRGNCQIFTFTKYGTGLNSFDYIPELIYSGSFPNNRTHDVFLADLNADGKTDVLTANKNTNNSHWNIFASSGIDFKPHGSINFSLGTPYLTQGDFIKFGDFDGNGFIDIAKISGHTAVPSGALHTNFDVYYNKGGRDFFPKNYKANGIGVKDEPITGDFNGDGKTDIFNETSKISSTTLSYDNLFFIEPNSTDHLLETVLDGFNRRVDFRYAKMTIGSTYSLSNTNQRSYPLNIIRLPMYLVSEIDQPNGIGGINTTTYHYEDALLHRGGIGFLGFTKITSNNAALGVYTESLSEVQTRTFSNYPTVYFPYQKSSLTRVGTIETTTETVQDVVSRGTNRWWIQSKITTTKNSETGVSSIEEVKGYDANGNVTESEQRIEVGGGATTPGTVIEKIKTLTPTYSANGSWIPYLPLTTTVTKSRKDEADFVTQTTRGYYPKGNLQFEKITMGTIWTQTDFSTPNQFGQSETKTISGSGVIARSSKMEYSANGRFVEKSYNVLNQVEKLEDYDLRWGKPKQTTSIGGIVSRSKFDAFGRIYETSVDLKNPASTRTTTVTYAWELNTIPNSLYSITTAAPDKPTIKEYFDKLERSIKKEVTGFNSSTMQSTTKYNVRGLVEEKTAAHKSTATAAQIVTTTTDYDALGRATNIQVSGISGSTIISYTADKSKGEMAVETTSPVSKKSTQVSDATGKTIKVIDDGGYLKMYYKSHGAQYKVINDKGQVLTETVTFDDAGRATKTRELNSGDSDYSFNAYGEMLTSKVANAIGITSMTYTLLGQMETRTGPEGFTKWDYYPTGSGASTNAIQKITGFNGSLQEYVYDADGRLETYTESIKKPNVSTLKVFVTNYTYYPSGSIKTHQYPDGLKLQHEYDGAGYLKMVKDITNGAGFRVYEATETDTWGHLSKYTLGNNVESNKTFDKYGYPRRFQANGIQDMEFNFNINSGNLDSRKDINKSLIETFIYDEDGLKLDRLSRINGPNGQVMSMIYDKNGNIKFKTGLLDYTYHPTKIHAVTRVENYPTDLNRGVQNVTYTPFHNAETITEKFNIGGQKWTEKIEIAYGSDYERNYTKFVGNNKHSEYEIFYGGDYEELNISGNVKKIHYIYGGDGLCAMAVDEGNGQGNQYHYVYKDYLGSILILTDANGSIECEQSFDAWGRRRFANSWVPVPSNAMVNIPIWLYRGFTGHEHYDRLTGIQLINMNARLYDPVNARMLRWDIATSGGTQGMNRYSYALNNPLKYTDPSGNNPILIAMAVGAAVGVFTNGMMNIQQGNNFFKGAVEAGIRGAISGLVSYGIGTAAGGIDNVVQKFFFQMAAHGFTGGISSFSAGGSFAEGFASGAISSMVSSTLSFDSKGDAFASIMIGGVSGGISATVVGGNFWRGFGQGLITSGLNHAAHAAAREIFEGGPGDPKPTKSAINTEKLKQMLERLNQPITVDGLYLAGLGLSLETTQLAVYDVSKINGVRSGQWFSLAKMRYYGANFNGNRYTGWQLGAKSFATKLGYFGKGIGALQALDIYNQYNNNQITTTRFVLEQTSNTVATFGGLFGGAWGVGWEIGRKITQTNWYHNYLFLPANPGGRDGLITTNK